MTAEAFKQTRTRIPATQGNAKPFKAIQSAPKGLRKVQNGPKEKWWRQGDSNP